MKQETLEDVNYADDLLRARLNDDEDPPTIPNDLQQLLLVTKFRHWQYEDEVRRFVELSRAIFDEQKKIYYWALDDAMKLRKVILGSLCPRSELESVRSLVTQANSAALVSRSRLAFGRFEVRPDGRYPPR